MSEKAVAHWLKIEAIAAKVTDFLLSILPANLAINRLRMRNVGIVAIALLQSASATPATATQPPAWSMSASSISFSIVDYEGITPAEFSILSKTIVESLERLATKRLSNIPQSPITVRRAGEQITRTGLVDVRIRFSIKSFTKNVNTVAYALDISRLARFNPLEPDHQFFNLSEGEYYAWAIDAKVMNADKPLDEQLIRIFSEKIDETILTPYVDFKLKFKHP